MRRVFVVNKSAHDFSPAEEFGELTFLSEHSMNRYAVNNMHREFSQRLEDSGPDDLILLCGLSIMNVVACSIFSHMHGRLNLLIYKDRRYVERNLVL